MILPLLAMLLLFGLGMPVAMAMLVAAILYAVWVNPLDLMIIAQKLQAGVDSFPLLAVPFFLLTGELMSRSGVTRRLIDLAMAFVGHLRGALAHVNIVTNMLMAGISGSATADAAATGGVLIPELIRRGYGRPFAAAITAAAATIGPIIPPSIMMVVYGSMANVSVGRLFLGGVVPGVLMGIYLMAATVVLARRRDYKVERQFSAGRLFEAFRKAFLALLVPLIVVGGIVAGVFTATEAGVIAVAAVLFLGIVVYRSLSARDIWESARMTLYVLGPVMLAVAAANVLGWMLAVEEAAAPLQTLLTSLSREPIVILLLIDAVLLVLGCFVEVLALLILLTPVLVPVISRVGIDPVHFGVVITLVLTIGTITPPVGLVMYVTSRIAGITLGEFSREIWPLLLALVAALVSITVFPQLVLWMPNRLMR